MASPRPRLACSRTGIEPDNDDTHTAATISIDGLFHLSVGRLHLDLRRPGRRGRIRSGAGRDHGLSHGAGGRRRPRTRPDIDGAAFDGSRRSALRPSGLRVLPPPAPTTFNLRLRPTPVRHRSSKTAGGRPCRLPRSGPWGADSGGRGNAFEGEKMGAYIDNLTIFAAAPCCRIALR